MKTLLTFLFAGCISASNLMAANTTAPIAALRENSTPPPSLQQTAAKTPPKSAQKKASSTMSLSKKCKDTNLNRDQCMIELILEDLSANYDEVWGGGISSIKAASSTSYIVSLPQEERVDIFTYEFEIKKGIVSLKSKVASTESFGSPYPNAGGTKNK
ncbi:MAG: hypothetical protein K1X48_05940 [Burkholderiaceae bacterium]|nr:hypothetical protein [Burkholderiaceae bacterium]